MNTAILGISSEFVITNLINVATEAIGVFSSFQALSPNSFKRITELSKGEGWKEMVDEIKNRFSTFSDSQKPNEKLYAEGLGNALQLVSALEKGEVKANPNYVRTLKRFSELLPNEKDEVLDMFDALADQSQSTIMEQKGDKTKIVSAAPNLSEQIEFFKGLDTWDSAKNLIDSSVALGKDAQDSDQKWFYENAVQITKMIGALDKPLNANVLGIGKELV